MSSLTQTLSLVLVQNAAGRRHCLAGELATLSADWLCRYLMFVGMCDSPYIVAATSGRHPFSLHGLHAFACLATRPLVLHVSLSFASCRSWQHTRRWLRVVEPRDPPNLCI